MNLKNTVIWLHYPLLMVYFFFQYEWIDRQIIWLSTELTMWIARRKVCSQRDYQADVPSAIPSPLGTREVMKKFWRVENFPARASLFISRSEL